MDDEKKTRILEEGDHFGDYTVVKLLGKGGMGAVYLMRGTSGAEYAVKIMYPDKVTHDLRRRFAHEAEFAIKIRHKNLVSVFDVGEDPETDLCYMIMDYVAGGSLADLLKRRGRLPIEEAVSIFEQIASALNVAHGNGLVHRDIKPDNILFDADGTPRLADLGVAKFDDAQQSMVTTTGMVIGTPAYMAPEQMLNSHQIDARADIYALGVVLYEMLSGKRPNEGRTAIELMAKAIKGEPLPDIKTICPDLAVPVAHVVSLMCAPKPEARPQTALAAAELLHKAASGRLVLVKKRPSTSAADEAARQAKRKRWFKFAAVFVGVAALLLLGVAGWIKALSRQESTQQTICATGAETVKTNVVCQIDVVTNSTPNVREKSSYVSRSALHAAYRSKDRKRVFVETVHGDSRHGCKTPPFSLERVKSDISDGVDIIWVRLGRTKDNVLFSAKYGDIRRSSNGEGSVRDYTADEFRSLKVKHGNDVPDGSYATLEELLQYGKDKVLFKLWYERRDIKAIADALAKLLNRIDAWESVILEIWDADSERMQILLGDELWRRICSGELQTMIHPSKLREWATVVPECSVWVNNWDVKKLCLVDGSQRIAASFVIAPGEADRTDDEAGWDKALADGVTVFRTRNQKELIRFLNSRGVKRESCD